MKCASRYPILVTSSFLNGWREPYLRDGMYPGDPIHMDEICIPGGKIEDLNRAYMAEYAYMGSLVNVILAAGLNNFRHEEPESIMNKIRDFKETINKRRDGSTFAICTISFAPNLV